MSKPVRIHTLCNTGDVYSYSDYEMQEETAQVNGDVIGTVINGEKEKSDL